MCVFGTNIPLLYHAPDCSLIMYNFITGAANGTLLKQPFFTLACFVKVGALNDIIPVMIASEVKLTIIFPAAGGDWAALDQGWELSKRRREPPSLYSSKWRFASLFKGDMNASALNIHQHLPPFNGLGWRHASNRVKLTQLDTRDIDIHGDRAGHLKA